jgi:hypothetical protein
MSGSYFRDPLGHRSDASLAFYWLDISPEMRSDSSRRVFASMEVRDDRDLGCSVELSAVEKGVQVGCCPFAIDAIALPV